MFSALQRAENAQQHQRAHHHGGGDGLHAQIFYLGVRRFIYNMPLDDAIDSIIEAQVMNFLGGIAANLPQAATAPVKRRRSRAIRRN